MLFMALFTELSRITWEHCKCRLLMTYCCELVRSSGWSAAAETAILGCAKVISSVSGASSIGHSMPQFIIPRADGVNRMVAYSPRSMHSVHTWSLTKAVAVIS